MELMWDEEVDLTVAEDSLEPWTEVSIGEICSSVKSGGTPLSTVKEYYENGQIPWLKTKEIKNGRIYGAENYISELGLLNSSASLIPPNSISVAMYGDGGTAGRVGLTKVPLTTNQACCNLTIDERRADYEFIFYNLLGSYDDLVAMKTGSGQQNLSSTLIKNFKLNLPPLPEQRAVAGVLSSLDEKIDLLHRQNSTLEALAETLFRQWFVEEAKEEWENSSLADIISVKGGTTPSTTAAEFWDGSINWTTPKDLSNHTSVFLFDTERKITQKGLAKIGSGLLPIGTVLLSSRAPIGYLAITNIPLAINQGYIAILCDKKVSNYFMYLWCKTNLEEIKSNGNGSVFQEISKSVFKELKITVPPKDVLTSFDKVIHPSFEKIRNNQIQIRTLSNLRDTLLPKLMSGEVRVAY